MQIARQSRTSNRTQLKWFRLEKKNKKNKNREYIEK